MLGLEVGDHGQVGRQLEERAIELVGLAYQDRGLTNPGVGVEIMYAAADDHRWIGPHRGQDVADQGRGGGLSVGAGNCHSAPLPHELGQHLRSSDDRHFEYAGRRELSVVRRHRGRDHQRVNPLEVSRVVPTADDRSELGQSLGALVVSEITAAHRHAFAEEHLGDAAHADAADPHQVEMRTHAPPPTAQTRSAIRAAAPGRATSRARAPIARSAS